MAADEEEAKPPPKRRWSTAAYALVTAVLALASGVVGFVFDLFPGLRPDPRTNRGAEMRVLQSEPQVAVGDWLRRTTRSEAELRERTVEYLRLGDGEGEPDPDPDSPDAQAELTVPGRLFYVHTTIEGLKRSRVRLRWSIYSHRSMQRVRRAGLRDVEALRVRLDAPTDRSVHQVWTPLVVARGRYFVRFELRDREGALLAVADSPPFAGLKGPG